MNANLVKRIGTGECDSCGYHKVELTFYPWDNNPWDNEQRGTPGKRICQLCADTMTGRSLQYPNQFPHADVMKTICHVGNAILAAIEKRK